MMENIIPIYELQIEQNEGSDVEVDFVALVDRPAIQRGFLAFKEARQNFVIQDEEQRIISGPLMLADTPIYRNDAIRGEYYVVFSADTIKQIAQKFFKKGYQNNVNLMHNSGDVQEGLTMFESWIVDKKRGIQPMVGFEDVPDGSWFGSYKVENDEAWNKVKSGEVLGFSVEGNFLYKEQEQMTPEEKMMNEIIKLLQKVK